VIALSWIGIVVGAAAVLAYFGAIALRPNLVRIVNGFGLFFTGLGLVQTGLLARQAEPTSWLNADIAVIALSIAAAMQVYGALRHRGAWDGADRRAEVP
jgi:hypothetical protein